MKKIIIFNLLLVLILVVLLGFRFKDKKNNGTDVTDVAQGITVNQMEEYFYNIIFKIEEVTVDNNQSDNNQNTIPEYNISLDIDLQKYVYEQSNKYGWSYEYLLAIAYVESRFDIEALNTSNRNGTHDGGLYQINSANYNWLNKHFDEELDLYNPYHNIDAAIVLLNYLRDKFVEMEMTQEELFYMITLAYNRGESGAIKYVEKNGFNNDYVDKVLDIKEQLEQYGTIQ